MIVINRDKELVSIETWNDITERPGFNGDLDPRAHTLDSIIGRYAFRDYVPCGLSNCHTPHGRGYIAVTKDGQETNIGKDCGKKYFGVDFETLSAKFDRDIQEKEYRERAGNFLFKSEEVAQSIRSLLDGEKNGAWIYKTSRPLIEGANTIPVSIVRKISEMVRNNTSLLYEEREATEEEIQQIEKNQLSKIKRPHVISVPIAEIIGLDALQSEYNIKDILVISLETELRKFEALDIDTLDFNALKKWSKWIGEVDGLLHKAEVAIEKGRKLLKKGNLQPFSQILSPVEREHSGFSRYLDSLPD